MRVQEYLNLKFAISRQTKQYYSGRMKRLTKKEIEKNQELK